MERVGSEDHGRDTPPSLRVAGYVTGHAEHSADEEIARQAGGVTLPNISDYWPDAPRRSTGDQPDATARPGAAARSGGAGEQPGDPPAWQVLLPTTQRPTVPGRDAGIRARAATLTSDGDAHQRLRRPALLAGLLALVIGTGTVLLVRTANDNDDRPAAVSPPAPTVSSAPAPTGPASVAPPPPTGAAPSSKPSPSAEQTSAAPAAPPPEKPLPDRVHFVLADGVTELSVRTSDLGDDPFRVSAAPDSGLDVDTSFSDGRLRVETDSDGDGTGRLDVRLNRKIIWHLQLNAGVRIGEFDLDSGTVSRIDLDGGAERFDISLGRLFSTLPIRMTGGVNRWRIATADEVPVKVNVGNGAGDVEVYGRSSGGVGERETIRSGNVRESPGLDIDAAAGLGSLKIFED